MDTHEAKVYTALLIVAIIVGIVIAYFIFTIIIYHRKHIALYKEKVGAEIATLEAERKRIAEDLHDDISPFLSTIKLQMNCLNVQDEEDEKILENNNRLIDDILKKVRETSNNLLPAVLVRKGLLYAIREVAETINQANQLKVILQIPEEPLTLTSHQELHIFRVFQESLNNCIKHANATEFLVQIDQDEKGVQILLKDNGKGFNVDNITGKRIGLGLKNIINRIDLLKGDIFQNIQPGKGVAYNIIIPTKEMNNG
jgi:two-component system, NarL family, sensor kinase